MSDNIESTKSRAERYAELQQLEAERLRQAEEEQKRLATEALAAETQKKQEIETQRGTAMVDVVFDAFDTYCQPGVKVDERVSCAYDAQADRYQLSIGRFESRLDCGASPVLSYPDGKWWRKDFSKIVEDKDLSVYSEPDKKSVKTFQTRKSLVPFLSDNAKGVYADLCGKEFKVAPLPVATQDPIFQSFPSAFQNAFVKIPGQDYYMMKTEATNAMWEFVMGSRSPSPQDFDAPDQPVVMVSYDDVEEFNKRASAMLPNSWEMRLPTDAEWEAAARAGTTTEYFWGDDADQICFYANTITDLCEDGYKTTAPVGQFQPNDYGLYDTSGNVWEWTSSNYRQGDRVLRGGSWCNDEIFARSAFRFSHSTGTRHFNVGFRAVVAPRTSK